MVKRSDNMPQLNRDDIFVNLAITVGPKFLDGKKFGTNLEVADLLKSYATRYDGILRELFVILAKYYTHLPLTPLREFPLLSADAPGGLSSQYGSCGSCGNDGYFTYVNGQEQPGCTPCSP
jgi:hypothetical protein